MARRLSAVRLQRQQALARRRPNKVSNEPDEPPNLDSIEIMQTIDGMSPRWRALVHYYGFVVVNAMYDDGHGDLMASWAALEARKAYRQAEWLATDYIPKRTNRGKP